jgi:collagenase-like PrtC family protease
MASRGEFAMAEKVKKQVAGLKVPFNWDMSLLDELGAINRNCKTLYPVVDVYAADKYSVVGSGRTAATVRERALPIGAYIEKAHSNGIKFEYLWNAITLSGREWDDEFQNEMFEEAHTLVSAGVDSFTVSHPLLTLKLKQWFPDVTVTSSVNNHLDSIEKISQLIQYVSFDRIMLDNRSSRNFGLIRKVQASFPENPIIVLANEACLPDCVLQSCHQEHTAHASRRGNEYNAPDLCRILCSAAKLKNPVYTLKAPWIRPEDIHFLFEAGATLVKLAGRTENSEWIQRLCEAYARGEYSGDIWELIEKPGSVRPEWESVLNKKLDTCRYSVNNAELSGFMEPFVEGTVPCVTGNGGCGSCTWCDSWLHTVKSPGNLEERLADIGLILDYATKDRQSHRSAHSI